MIEEERGEHFDPAVVDAFLQREDDFLKVVAADRRKHADSLEPTLLAEACR